MDEYDHYNNTYSFFYQLVHNDQGKTKRPTISTTPLGLVLPIISASISFVSCTLILIIIARSNERLSSTYHRIMGMSSFCLLFSSASIALTTIPMPKDVVFHYAGKSYGNTTTCIVQGLLFIYGYKIHFFMEKAMFAFYFFRIGLCVKQKYLTRFFDPAVILVVIWICLQVKSESLNFENINPSPVEPWCTNTSYPPKCSDDKGVGSEYFEFTRCIRGKHLPQKPTNPLLQPKAYLILNMLWGIGLILLTILLVYRRERKIKVMVPILMNTVTGQELILTRIRNESVLTKIMLKQAIVLVVVHMMNHVITPDVPFILQQNLVNLFKLKGLWILLIFLYDKVCNERYLEEGLSFGAALKHVICNPYKRPAVTIVGLDVVRFHENQEAQRAPSIGMDENMSSRSDAKGAWEDDSIHENQEAQRAPSIGMDENMSSRSDPEGAWEDDSNLNDVSYGFFDSNSNGISYGDEGSRGAQGGAVSSTGIRSSNCDGARLENVPEGGYYADVRKKTKI